MSADAADADAADADAAERRLKLDSHQRRASVFQRDLTGVKLCLCYFETFSTF